MKKNKIVKPLVIATAVAAVAGIAAVSFAEWKGATKDLTVTGHTGEIVTSANITADSNLSGENAKLLVPYNQVQQYEASTMTKVWEITLTPGADESLTNYVYTITTTSTLNLYVYTGKVEDYAAPSGTIDFDDEDCGWSKLSNTATTVTLDSGKIYVILDSSNNNDMDKEISVTITAATKGYVAPTEESSS